MASVWRFPFGASRALLRRIAGRAVANTAARTAASPNQTASQAGYVVARNATGLDGTSTPTIRAAFISSGAQFFAPTVPSNVTLVAPVVASTAGFPDSTKPYQGAILPLKLGSMPHISRGKPIYGTGNYSKMNDGGYGYDIVAPGAWTAAAGDWVAINLGSGPSQILVALSNDLSAIGGGSTYLTSSFAAYRLQVSNDSTNGSDGTWTTVVTETTNPAMNREHKFSFTGYSWVKLICDTISGGQLDELDVWDASAGTDNTFAFLGDSLSVRGTQRYTYFGGGVQPSFQENTNTNTGRYPLQLSAGVAGQSAAGWATDIASVLALYPDVKYWAIGIGMNDGATMPGAISTWRTNMQTVIDAILADGRIPILARVSWTGSATYGGGDFDTCGLAYLNENGVEWLFQQYGASLRRGPDLYKLFYDNRVAYAVETDPHWNDDGTIAWNAAWANSLGTDTSRTLVAPFISSGSQVFAATEVVLGASGTTLQPPLISSGAQTFGPTLTNLSTVVAPFISSGGQTFGPTLVSTIVAPRIESTAQTFAPALIQSIVAPRIESGVQFFGPTLVSTIVAPFISSGSQTFGPTLVSTLVAPLISSSSQVYSPALVSTIVAPRIESTAQTFAPVLSNLNTVQAPFISSGSQVFGPTVGQFTSLVAPRIESTEQFFGSTLSNLSTITAAFISSGSQTFGPTLVSTVAAPRIESTAQVFAASLTQSIAPSRIESTAQVFGPTLTNLSTVVAPFISSSSQVFGPTVGQFTTLAAPRIESTEQVFGPALSNLNTVQAPFISSGSQVFGPTVGQFTTLAAPRIESTEQVFGATLTSASTLVAPQIGSTAQVYAPTLSALLTAPRIESTGQFFGPTLTSALTLTPSLLGPTATTFVPSVIAGATNLQPPQIGSTAQVYSPALSSSYAVQTPVIGPDSTVNNPALAHLATLVAPRVDSTAQLFGPSIAAVLGAPFLSGTAQTYSPTVTGLATIQPPVIPSAEQIFAAGLASNNTIATPVWIAGTQIFEPSVIAVVAPPRIGSGSQTFSPNLVLGAGWPEPTQTIPLIRALELPLPTTVTRIVGIHQSDIIIRSAIEAGLADIRANTWLLDYVFASLPQDSLTWKEYGEKSVQEVKKWFISTHIPVTLGPRMDESKFPQINIELLESSEVVPEAIIGDVNYDPHETNDTSWPALTPPFTPVSYTPSTGLVVLGAAPEAWVGKGMYIIDRTGKAFEIVEGVSDKSFKIDPGSVGDFRQCVLKGHRPNWIVDVESSSFKETYRVGIHTTDPVHLTWLHAIMQFALLRYKQVLLEARGFERSTIASSQVARDQSYETENVFVRYITVSGYVRQFWPKTVAPVIDGVELDALSVSGQDADVSIAKVDDPVEQLWVGNLDTIRTRR